MRPIITIPIVAALALACLSFSFSGMKNKTGKHPLPAKGFAVVELFTSEGCSSCPPADEAAIRLAKEFPENVFFLGFHVDYWDKIGWKDAFSNAEYTDRQRKYASAFNLESIYTPQSVVNGEKQLVGSSESELRGIIKEQLKKTASTTIQLSANAQGNDISIEYKIAAPEKQLLNIALVQSATATDVKRGENRGHLLHHMNVVRSFKTISVSKDATGTITLSLPAGLKASDLQLISYTQNTASLVVTGATKAMLP